MKNIRRTRSLLELHPSQVLAGVFIGFIITGALLLKLPIATHDGISFVDAIFTATSAACVTGLMVVDAGSTFTLFGQLVILGLIQIGALGIMTFSVFFTMLLGKSLSLRESSYVFETFDPNHQITVRELLARIIQLTLLIEIVGFVFLFIRWLPDMGAQKAAYYALFHAVSGFCNAGITLFPDSLISYGLDLSINLIFGILIITGSLGFITIVELSTIRAAFRKRKRIRLSLQTKIVLSLTLALTLTGALLTWALEEHNALAGMSLDEQILTSIFMSISRTAGFVTIEFETFTNGSMFVYILLMFIGAAPGSVGGGIKLTTFGVLMALAYSRYNSRDKVFLFNKTVPDNIVARSISILFISIQIVIVFTLLLLIFESGSPGDPQHRDMFMMLMFEVVSAFGTVGLSAGASADLSEIGKSLVTLLMLIGRLGPLTVTMVIARKTPKGTYQYSEESMMVG